MIINRKFCRHLASVISLTVFLLASFVSRPVLADSFDALADRARGQTVYFNGWGGSPTVNAYIAWAGDQLQARYGITLVHVKLTDTADAVARILAKKPQAKPLAVRLIWSG